MRQWTAYCLLTISLSAAVLLRGGVYPQQWQWIALVIAAAAILGAADNPVPQDRWSRTGFYLLGALAAWMAFALLPLPPVLVEHLSPARWADVTAARTAADVPVNNWMALSYAPAATWERLLDILPCVAVFVAVRQMGWRRRERPWILAAPVIFIAWLESLLGLAQFVLSRLSDGDAAAATGTYVNRNHFAGLLELALPLTLLWALHRWRENHDAVVRVAALLSIAACLLAGIVVSQSRMGFLAALGSLAFVGGLLILKQRKNFWKWAPVLAIPVFLLVLLPSRELRERFTIGLTTKEVSTQSRLEIWRDSVQFVARHKLTGSGLGAYERGMYRYKTVKPTNTLDFAHNDYLQVVAELGIPGALLFAGVLICMFRPPWRTPHPELAIGLLGSMCAIALHSLTDFNLYIPANALAVAWLAGLASTPSPSEPPRASVRRENARLDLEAALTLYASE